MIATMQQELRLASEDPGSRDLAYVRYEDLRAPEVGLEDQSIIAVKAPTDTTLEVPDPKATRVSPSRLPPSPSTLTSLCLPEAGDPHQVPQR